MAVSSPARPAPITGLRQWLTSFGILAVGEGLSSVLRFGALVLVATRLGPAAFGTVSAGFAIGTYLVVFAHSGLEIVGTREIAAVPSRAQQWLAEVVGARLLMAIGIQGVALLTMLIIPVDHVTRLVIIGFSCSIFTVAADVRWSFVGVQRTGPVAAATVSGSAAYLTGVLLFVREHDHLVRVPLVQLGSEVLLAAILLVSSRRRFGGWAPRVRLRTLRPLLVTSAPVSMARGLRSLTISVDLVLVRVLLPGPDSGRYAAASRFASLGILYIGLYYNTFLPSVVRSRLSSAHDLRQLVDLAIRRARGLGTLLAVAATIATPVVIPLLLGRAYRGTVPLLQVLSWSLLLLSFSGVYTAVLLAARQHAQLARISATALTVNVAANLVLLPTVGTIGAALATVLTEGVSLALCYRAARPLLRGDRG